MKKKLIEKVIRVGKYNTNRYQYLYKETEDYQFIIRTPLCQVKMPYDLRDNQVVWDNSRRSIVL